MDTEFYALITLSCVIVSWYSYRSGWRDGVNYARNHPDN